MGHLNRRDFCFTAGALSASCALNGFAQMTAGSRPNFVYVLCDDLGWGDLDCLNPLSAIPTPNANRLAEQGMRWTDMHSGDAVCTPSRYGILTGRYCWRGKLQKGVLQGYAPDLIEPGRMTVASMLKSAGYYTAGFGKWHLGLGNRAETDYAQPLHPGPIDHGFDYYFGIPASLNMAPFLYFENDHVVEQATSHLSGNKAPFGDVWDDGPIAPHFALSEVLPTVTNKATSIIDQRGAEPEKPFFLHIAFPSPHDPWVPLPEYIGKSHAGKYGDYVVEVDDMLGKIMEALERNHLSDNTVIVYTSDNGADWKLDMQSRYAHRANGDWKGEKADIWEGGHRIPFIARWPGHIPAGTVCDQMGCLIDFMATAAAIDNIPLPRDAAEDSFNLLPALLGKATKPIRTTLINHSFDGMFCMREGNWKLEEGLGSGGFTAPARVDPGPGGPAGQLYDLSSDPHELHNLYQQRPEIVERLSSMLEMYRQQGYSRPM